jgi:hypothetical protein
MTPAAVSAATESVSATAEPTATAAESVSATAEPTATTAESVSTTGESTAAESATRKPAPTETTTPKAAVTKPEVKAVAVWIIIAVRIVPRAAVVGIATIRTVRIRGNSNSNPDSRPPNNDPRLRAGCYRGPSQKRHRHNPRGQYFGTFHLAGNRFQPLSNCFHLVTNRVHTTSRFQLRSGRIGSGEFASQSRNLNTY